MSLCLFGNFIQLLIHFRDHDLIKFFNEHKRLYEEAKRTDDYVACTVHYYSVMSTVIEKYFSGNFHFVPPQSIDIDYRPQCITKELDNFDSKKTLNNLLINQKFLKMEDALCQLHWRIGNLLKLDKGKKCVDIGCGNGGVIMDLEATGAYLTGLTVTPNDVETGTKNFIKNGIYNRCQILESQCEREIPLEAGSQDAAYAIYALKYFPKLEPVLTEISRILKSGGLFIVYDLIKTDLYDENNNKHREILEEFQFACGMPSLYTRKQLLNCCESLGLKLIKAIDINIESGQSFYYCFTSSSIFMWMIKSNLINYLIKIAEWLKFLPKGFYNFNKVFLAGTVNSIVSAGELDILNGGEILLFQKE